MNLDFGILWIEDSFSSEEEASLKRRVQDAGFIARIDVIPNGERIEEIGRKQSMLHCYDLILLDYKLRNADGDDLAPKIRQLFPSTTILFYSGNDNEDGLRSKIAARKVEGVYCSHRQRFIERTGALIDQTARALDRLSGMRGLAMRVVAECDTLMKDIVRSITKQDPRCKEKLSDLDNDTLSHLEQVKRRYEEASRGDLDARLNSFAVDSAKLFKHFRRLTKFVVANSASFGLDSIQVDRLRELRQISAQFDREVLGKRNVLGHVREIEGANGWTLEGNNEIRVGDFPSIRRVFASYIDAFREVELLIVSKNE